MHRLSPQQLSHARTLQERIDAQDRAHFAKHREPIRRPWYAKVWDFIARVIRGGGDG